jgi:hypothetical protein
MYNGCANYQTWNVKLWIANDEGLYNLARGCDDYSDFIMELREFWEENFLQVET